MKILVTGGAGFIGSHLIERLFSEKHLIWCLDNFNDFYDPNIKYQNIEHLKNNPNFNLHLGDILDEQLLNHLFSSTYFDIVVHLAARAGVRPSVEQPKLYQEVNIRGTINLLEMTKKYHVKKFIFASSSSVYGNNKKIPFSETDPVDNPISPYAATKKAGELLCYTYSALYDISIYCLRFFTVYGPRQRPDMAIHKFTKLIDQGKPITVYGNGSAKRDFTFISDIIDGVMKAIERCEGYNIYNLGESKVVQLIDLVQLIEKELNKKATIIYAEPQPGEVPTTFADISKAENELVYKPSVDIEQGIKKFIQWYKTVYTI